MRNYLLATAALVGFAGAAQAATFAPTDPIRHSSAFGAPATKPEPGKMIVHMGGLVAVDAVVANVNTDKSGLNTSKNASYGMGGYFRLYFGFDGRMTNGLIYGAKSEMRTNFGGGPGGGINNSFASTWSTRRAYGYVGGDSWGLIRIGQTDGPVTIFTGRGITTGEAFSTGAWDGDICAWVGAACLNWAFPVVGAAYVPNKIAYISPSFGGFQAGISFAPSNAALNANGNGQASAGGNNGQVTSALASDYGRPRNMIEAAVSWQGNLGPVAVDSVLGLMASDTVKQATGAGVAAMPAGVTGFKNPVAFNGGLSLTYMGASIFGHITSGSVNGVNTARPILASGRKKDQIAWVVGAMYKTGPWTVGTSYYSNDRQGSNAGTGNRQERGFALGGQYNVVTGFDVFLEYIWGSNKQAGVNYVDAAGPATANNKATTSALMASAIWRW